MKHTRHAAICDKYYLTKRTKAGNKKQFYLQMSENLRHTLTQTVLPTNSTQLTQYNVGALIYHVTQVAAAGCLFCVCDLLFPLRVSSYIVGHWHREARATCSVAACLNLGARAWSVVLRQSSATSAATYVATYVGTRNLIQ